MQKMQSWPISSKCSNTRLELLIKFTINLIQHG